MKIKENLDFLKNLWKTMKLKKIYDFVVLFLKIMISGIRPELFCISGAPVVWTTGKLDGRQSVHFQKVAQQKKHHFWSKFMISASDRAFVRSFFLWICFNVVFTDRLWESDTFGTNYRDLIFPLVQTTGTPEIKESHLLFCCFFMFHKLWLISLFSIDFWENQGFH